MGVIVLGARRIETPIVTEGSDPVWFGLRLVWTGWNGSQFVLSNPNQGVFVAPGDVEGFGPPEYDEWIQDSPAIPGQYFRGARAMARQVFLPTVVSDPAGSLPFEDLHRRFWDTVRRDKYGTLRLVTPSGVIREIQLRSTGEPPAFARDPFKRGLHGFGWKLVADDPFWSGNPVEERFGAGTTDDFFETSAGDTLFNISEGLSFSSASVTNPGDQDAWPVWTIIGGDTTTVTMGVGSTLVNVPFEVEVGKALQIDTNPRDRQAWYGDWDADAGMLTGTLTDRTSELGSTTDFAVVPPGENVTLDVGLGGSGEVWVSLIPLYERAW